MSKTTWYKLLHNELNYLKEELIYCSLSEALLHKEFDPGFGGNGDEFDFIAWTNNHVIINHEYDGSSNITSIKRNPPEEKWYHKIYFWMFL